MPRKKKPLRYFFFHGDLHKKLHINIGADVITCWNYPAKRTLKYSYIDVKKNGEKAFSTREVTELVRRGRTTVEMAIINGNIRRPSFAYKLTGSNRVGSYYWSEKDVLELHDYLSTVHIGRPRKDGLISTGSLPSARELRAMMNHNLVMGFQDEDGKFVPTWDAQRF